MKIAVTGATGFIGRYLIEELLWNKNDIFIFGRSLEKLKRYYPGNKKIYLIETDYSETDLLNKCAHYDAFIHLGSVRFLQKSEAFDDYYSNIFTAENIFRACKHHGTTNIVFASTGSIYNDKNNTLPFKETSDVRPQTFYALSKLTIEKLGFIYGLNIKSLRIARVLGWGECEGFMLMTFIKNAVERKPITIFGRGKGKREYIYVKDVTGAVIRAMEHPEISGVFNTGSGCSLSSVELAALINKILADNESEIRFDENKPEDKSISLMDSSEASKILGWKASYSIEAALEDMKNEFYKRQLTDFYDSI